MKNLGLGFAVLLIVLLVILSVASYALPVAAPEAEEYGFLAGGFLGFASLIVTLKLIPGIIRFASIIEEEEVRQPDKVVAAPGKSAA
ncbi:hypothetical protein KI811_10125 [Geobacter hydrogenophilus]|uniref:Uncharacterized protein n=1 Tax=Geobacter hydrogenophilus TaxID=40983 RepID=A0A9W6LDI6_9BACT|nr:hypothetical protein [Geobacter hydrogenophilus]MBT0894166.1 hypothetical protein [Geobacter hydrogenophilus]GLI38551.1 hypothetical protein GHYDROH2_20520 [Geobacter hydrogenophilus]